MTGAALSLKTLSEACVLDAASLQLLLAEEGLTVTIRDEIDHIVAQWPVVVNAAAGTATRKAVSFRRNDQGEWRGALLVSFDTPKHWDLVDTVPRFRDLLHVGIWLRGHAPKARVPFGPPRMD